MSIYLHQKSENKKALVTMAIGLKYLEIFNQYAKSEFKTYCERFGYDLICITEPLDHSERAQNRSPAWQKLLVLSQPWSCDYERILWLDTDILINHKNATDIAENIPLDKVGAVDQYSIPSKELYRLAFEEYYLNKYNEIPKLNNLSAASYYKNNGLQGVEGLTEVVQTGVWIASPAYHKEIFERIYDDYDDINQEVVSDQYEMPFMSYELITNDQIYWIQNQFNFDVNCHLFTYYPHVIPSALGGTYRSNVSLNQIEEDENKKTEFIKSLNAIYRLSIFMHFNGCHQIMINYADEIIG